VKLTRSSLWVRSFNPSRFIKTLLSALWARGPKDIASPRLVAYPSHLQADAGPRTQRKRQYLAVEEKSAYLYSPTEDSPSIGGSLEAASCDDKMQLSHPTVVGLRDRKTATMGERNATNVRPTSRI